MAIIQKNIWTIFYVLFLGALLFLGIVSYTKYHSIEEKYSTDQVNLVKLISNATHSLLLAQEMMLEILGNQTLKDHDPKTMDDLLILNPSIVAFGFVDLEGNYLYTSSNFNKATRPNLRSLEASKDSFEYTMTQNKMVLGRTYFIAASGRWGIPIRKAVFDENGKTVGVMTAGLGIEGAFKLYAENLSLGDYNKVTLIRDRDRFVQFQSTNQEIPKSVYEKPLPSEFFNSIVNGITERYATTLDVIKKSQEIYTLELVLNNHKTFQIAIKYDPRYELWILSEIDHQRILQEFIESFIAYAGIFLLTHVILFFLFRMIAQVEDNKRQDLFYQATHDSLTQLPNRSYLQHHSAQWIQKDAPAFSLFYLDMDHFKNINDSFGHHFGDLVLIEFAKRMTHLAGSDTVVIRQGGDEFILLSPLHENGDILAYAQTVMNEVAKPYHIKNFNFVVGASIGIAKYPEHGHTLDMLLRASDIAMYEAKKYKNSVRLFAPSMQTGYLNRVNVEQALHKALEKNELYMVYQPQINHDGTLYGVEALARWKSEDLGMVPPDQFIPVAEASGLMPRLGHFILSTTLKEMKALQDELGISFQTSINISVKQFMEAHFFENLTKEIHAIQIDHVSLCLEITESLFIEDVDYILPILQKIHDMGLLISMDDFGTGYSSLNMLRKLPIDELKIDKTFVDTLLNDVTAKKMVQNIITIGKNLELDVIAEGVETEEQEMILKECGCDRFQGYLYAKPLEFDVLKKFLIEKR